MIQQTETGEASPGSILIHLAHRKAKDSLSVQRKLFDYEKQLLYASFEADKDSPAFRENYATALRLALSSENNELFDLLLEKNVSRDVFKDEPDVLQIAIHSSRMAYKYNPEPEDFKKRIATLIDYGASIDTLDEKGRSPLYYTCIYGCPETFQLFLSLGANFSALFESYSSGDIQTLVTERAAPEIDSDEYIGDREKKNLLQITLNAQQSEGENSHMWGSMADSMRIRHEMWEPIVTYLLDAGLACPPDYPSLVSLLHASCYLGNLSFVEKLLDWGADHTAQAGPRKVRSQGLISGSALHFAAAMGKKDIALCLLKHGADPRTKYLCKRWQDEVLSTPVQLALNEAPNFHAGSISPEILDVCEILFDQGSDSQDGQLLFEACIKVSDRERCTKLLAQGFSIPENLICSDLGVTRLLLDHGYQFDVAKMQKNAIQGGHMDLMRFLVERYGPSLPLDDIEPIASHAIVIDSKEVLRYLVTEYGLDINSTFPYGPDSRRAQFFPDERINLLQLACNGTNGNSVEPVKLLLELGADPKCPRFPESLLVRLQRRIQMLAREQFFMIVYYIRLIRFLDQYSSEDLSGWTIITAVKVPEVRPRNQQIVNTLSVSKGIENVDAATEAPEQFTQTPDRKGNQLEAVSTATGRKTYTAGQLFPENEVEPHVYPSLPVLIKIIRVLQLEPSKSIDEPVCGHIVMMNWTQKPHFDCLSYDQGNELSMAGILIHDSVVQISQNLWLALRRLRYEDKPRFLWINELCLDQGNLKERNQYVEIMREIYQTANQVLLWTGEEDEDSHLIFEHLIDGEDFTERQKIDHMTAGDYPECDAKTQDTILKLCQRPCFFRSWIVPEISFAKDVIVICGGYTKKFELLLNINYRARENLHGRGSDLFPAVCYSKRGANVNHYDALKSIRHTPRWRSLESVREILVYSWFCDARDPRDHVYSLIALMDQPIMPIDYSLDVADIYRTFTCTVMEKFGGVAILHWMGSSPRRKDLPSWVQDFSISKPQGVLPGVYGIPPGNIYHFNGPPDTHPQPSFHFRGLSDFVVKGKYIESIQAIGPELVANANNKPGGVNFVETMCAWESLAVELAEKKRFSTYLTYAYLETITTSDTSSGRDIYCPVPFQLEPFIAWYRKYGTNIIRNADPESVQEIAFIQSWCHPPSQEESRTKASYFAGQMEMASYGRCFFITSENSMGLAPPRAKAGDELVFCPGALHPFVVRKREGDGSYELIGDCFLYDFDLNKLFDDESQEFKEFVLR